MRTEQSLGDYIRNSRIALNRSLRSLAEQMKIAPSYLSDIENDRRVPADDLLRRFGLELGADFNELLALAGRLDDDSERFIKSRPEAVRLFRRIQEANLSGDQIRELADRIPQSPQQKLEF